MTTFYQDLARASVLDRLWRVRYASAGDLCATGTLGSNSYSVLIATRGVMPNYDGAASPNVRVLETWIPKSALVMRDSEKSIAWVDRKRSQY